MSSNAPSRPQSIYGAVHDEDRLWLSPELRELWRKKPTDPLYQENIRRRNSRCWKPLGILDGVEKSVVDDVIDQTTSSGHETWKFYNKPMAQRVGCSSSTLRRAILRLKELGLLGVDYGKGDKLLITLNLNWEPLIDAPLSILRDRSTARAKVSQRNKNAVAVKEAKKVKPVSDWARPVQNTASTPITDGCPPITGDRPPQSPMIALAQSPMIANELQGRKLEEVQLEEKKLSAPAGTDGPVPVKENSPPIRLRHRQRPNSSSEERKSPPVPAAPPEPIRVHGADPAWLRRTKKKEAERREMAQFKEALRQMEDRIGAQVREMFRGARQ
ncbi:hypothetical protein FJ527_04765 [Mesorhizobium sp. B2-4-18]|uniref:hypothetical protein n=1 Tax=Mesorhizobium sp. B2-4-18 TaxID=2589931 RepID=UPI00112789A0|nr:hypothetical protein [Mesorhizobium sp. B2-4-18]TPK79434.1 hypothetical protein FJ527_04765 [Mesorhizobium sp. B2-4-18]